MSTYSIKKHKHSHWIEVYAERNLVDKFGKIAYIISIFKRKND
jgi:hypothetical protein